MNFLKKLFGGGKPAASDALVGGKSKTIPESDLALDEDTAKKLIAEAAIGGTTVGLSADHQRMLFVSRQAFSPSEINGLRKAIEQARVQLELRYIEMPTYPVFVLRATILDNSNDPFWLETFLNIGGPDEMVLPQLVRPRTRRVCFHFYDATGSLLLRAGYAEMNLPGQNAGQVILKAKSYLESLPPAVRNFQAAVQQLIRENP